ncbi:hypothetical protein B0H16DRAFT_1901250 [Mycena metata]|uniref:DUF6533 domain-containing protein n=1 Tax=Mycena metata TaxID=1033252 RepID=A0AAD7GZM2_9AGAR|nr:hypothetical protein B0H16DRAFT_1901250 [Mycena metata]
MPTAYVMSFVAIVLSFVVHVDVTVFATAPIPFPCAAYQPSTEHGVTHSHPRFMATRRGRITGICVRLYRSVVLAGLAVLLVYDHTLTLATEVKFIWAAKLRPSIYWFLALNHEVGVFVSFGLNSQRSLLRGVTQIDIFSFFFKLPDSSCVKMQIMWKALIVSQELLVECTLIMRVFAMYNRNRWILICLLAVFAPWPALTLWDVIEEGQPQIFSGPGISGIACNILVFLLTVRRAYVQRETYPRYAGTLLWRMTKDGAWYFGIIIIANAANLVTFYVGAIFLTGFLSWFITSLSITLLARLMLNLHEAAAVGMTGEEPNTIELETLRFATVQMTVDVGA